MTLDLRPCGWKITTTYFIGCGYTYGAVKAHGEAIFMALFHSPDGDT